MVITIASIMNLRGPDLMVIFLIVLLLFGAKKLPELARGMGRAVKEFGAARDEIERELTESKSGKTTQSNSKGELTTCRLSGESCLNQHVSPGIPANCFAAEELSDRSGDP
jgi:sec-independent protein translocase protein TatA